MLYFRRASFFVLIIILFLTGCRGQPNDDIIINDSAKIDWAVNGEKAFQSLMDIFWDEDRSIFYSDNSGSTDLNYWWQAHGLDALVDASLRVGDNRYFDLIASFYDGINVVNNGFINDFYDDMSWMAIALIRSFNLTGEEKYLMTAKLLWEDIITGWNENNGGGIAWNKSMLNYKNTPSNATAAILSFRLYQITKEDKYLSMGEKIILWLENTLVDSTSGLVWDGIGRNGGNEIDFSWLFTYNQGIYIGACIEYYIIVQDEIWLKRALKTADNALYTFRGNLNVLPDEGEGDGGLFKGIFIRYLEFLTNRDYLEESKYIEYRGFIRKNAEKLWEYGKSTEFPYLFNHDWTKSPTGSTDLSVQLSGVVLTEVSAWVEKNWK
jgi:predicted alpha-1,6-mannanase (GH76 family)